jgi:hypothetical protein
LTHTGLAFGAAINLKEEAKPGPIAAITAIAVRAEPPGADGPAAPLIEDIVTSHLSRPTSRDGERGLEAAWRFFAGVPH